MLPTEHPRTKPTSKRVNLNNLTYLLEISVPNPRVRCPIRFKPLLTTSLVPVFLEVGKRLKAFRSDPLLSNGMKSLDTNASYPECDARSPKRHVYRGPPPTHPITKTEPPFQRRPLICSEYDPASLTSTPIILWGIMGILVVGLGSPSLLYPESVPHLPPWKDLGSRVVFTVLVASKKLPVRIHPVRRVREGTTGPFPRYRDKSAEAHVLTCQNGLDLPVIQKNEVRHPFPLEG